MTISCPNCGVAGPNLNCNLHPMPNFGNMTNPCKEIPQPLIDEEKRWLFAETARLSLRLRAAELQAHTLQAKLSDLEADGTIDQMGRKLPLPDHHKDCPHGQNGWAVCYCEEIDKIDAAVTHGAPKCSKCGDTGRTTILGEGIAIPTWCTCPKGRPSPLAESVTKAFQQAAADAVRTTLDRGGTAVGEVHGQWQVVSKTCEHGNTECQKCGVGQPVPAIKTPEGKPLFPAAEFSRMRIEDNKERGLSECNFLRQTGRTTAMVIEALEFLKKNTSNDVGVRIDVYNQGMKKRINELFLHYADELGGVRHSWITRVTLRTLDELIPRHNVAQLNLRDNALDDAKSFKDLVEEGQELRKKFDKDTAGMRGAPNCPKCGNTGLISYGPGTGGMKRCDCRTRRPVKEDEFTRVMNETYEHLPPRPRDPRQDLKAGDHVRFEIEGIIKERQSAGIFQDEDGSDFEPIQYAIKDSINGMTYYVGYHQITKKIGSVE